MSIEQQVQLRLEAARMAAGMVMNADDLVDEAERIYQWLLNGKTA